MSILINMVINTYLTGAGIAMGHMMYLTIFKKDSLIQGWELWAETNTEKPFYPVIAWGLADIEERYLWLAIYFVITRTLLWPLYISQFFAVYQ